MDFKLLLCIGFVFSSASVVSNWEQVKPDDCWSACGRKGGACSWCGSNGYCCRKGYGDCPSGAGDVSTDMHRCVREIDAGSCEVNLCSSSKGCTPIKNTLLTTLPEVKKVFYISFEFLASKYSSDWQSIIHFTATDSDSGLGRRVPGIWVYGTGKLGIWFNENEKEHDFRSQQEYPVDQWRHMEFSQTLENNKYMYRVRVNGEIIIEVENSQPKEFQNVKVYASSPWWSTLNGSLRKVVINTDGSNKCSAATSEVSSWTDYEEDDGSGSGSGSGELDDEFDPTGFNMTDPDDSSGLVAVSDNCSGYGIDNLPHPRILVLGRTGVGKSTLSNQLLGRNPLNKRAQLFTVGKEAESQTIEITYVVGNWLGDGPCFTIIDTPGTSDSEGRDYEHALAMTNIMKDQIKSVDVFLLCFSGANPKFDQSTVSLLKLYVSIFSKEMWKHAMTEVTYWSHDKKSAKKRKRNLGITEKKRHKQWNAQYKQELGVTIDIPSVYIDPVLEIHDAEAKEDLSPREIKAFEKYTEKLFAFGNTSDPFVCDGNCKAPNGYFLGKPWIEANNISKRQEESVIIKCQIWNGIKGRASENVTWTHNGEIIYQKVTNKNGILRNSTDNWGSNVKFSEVLSPGEGHYTEFIIEFESLEESMEGQYDCENGLDTEDNFAEVSMIVDGSWEQWGSWGKCSISCLGEDDQMGSKKRVRKAVPPKNGGKPVNPLDGEDNQNCAGELGPQKLIRCPKNFSWNEWTEWSDCSPRCGDGTTYRIRSCNQGSHGGQLCPLSIGQDLSEKEEKACNMIDCPDCILLGWQEWSQCTQTCLGHQAGTRTRQRSTEEADPDNPLCNPDDHSQKEICNTNACPVDGGWTPYSSYGPCSATCTSEGSSPPTQKRTRTCTEPAALHGGKPCSGKREETRECNTKIFCPDLGICTSSSPCEEQKGDCDKDSDCAGSLICGTNNCRDFYPHARPSADCCVAYSVDIRKDAPIMPNIGYLFRGYDIMKGNPLDVNTGLPLDPGFREPIFKAEYKSYKLTPDQRYLQPDGTSIQDCSGSCLISFASTEISGTKSYQKSLENRVSASLGVSYMGFDAAFSASASFKEVDERSSSHSSLFTQSSASCCSYLSQTLTYQPPPFSDNFRAALRHLPSNYDEPSYSRFIQTFGTHYIKEAQLGALFGQQSEISRSAWASMKAQGRDISAEASASGFGITASAGYANSQQKKQAEDFAKISTRQKTFSIGSPPPGDNEVSTWVSQTKASPVPMFLKLGLIVELFEFNKIEVSNNVKANIQKALDDYCENLRKINVVQTCSPPSDDKPFPNSRKLWRDDGRCGKNYPLALGDGEPGQCDPAADANEKGPCCSEYGWCGNTYAHCFCKSNLCVNYAGDKFLCKFHLKYLCM